MLSFSTWPALSNQNADYLSEGGFFYTGTVICKQKNMFVKKQIFSRRPYYYKIIFVTVKKPHHVFPLRYCSKGLENY